MEGFYIETNDDDDENALVNNSSRKNNGSRGLRKNSFCKKNVPVRKSHGKKKMQENVREENAGRQ